MVSKPVAPPWNDSSKNLVRDVASHLQRSVTVDKAKAPDYSQPGGPVEEAAVPASAASIHAVAGLHAVLTLDLLADLAGCRALNIERLICELPYGWSIAPPERCATIFFAF